MGRPCQHLLGLLQHDYSGPAWPMHPLAPSSPTLKQPRTAQLSSNPQQPTCPPIAQASWASLSSSIVAEIALRLPRSASQQLALGAVCSAWRQVNVLLLA